MRNEIKLLHNVKSYNKARQIVQKQHKAMIHDLRFLYVFTRKTNIITVILPVFIILFCFTNFNSMLPFLLAIEVVTVASFPGKYSCKVKENSNLII